MKKIKLLILVTLMGGSMTATMLGNSQISLADEVQTSEVVAVEKPTPYTIEIIRKHNDVKRDSILEPKADTSRIVVDYSNATFYDENWNEVDKEQVMKTIVPNRTRAWTNGGSWQTGSGYAICTGLDVRGFYMGLETVFRSNFQYTYSGADRINSISNSQATGIGSFSWMNRNFIGRSAESGSNSAYGGLQGQWANGTFTKTLFCWLRVGGDTHWIDANY